MPENNPPEVTADLTHAQWQQFQQKYPDHVTQLTESNKQLISQFWLGSEYAFQLSLKNYQYLQNCLTDQHIELSLNDIQSLNQLNQVLLTYREQVSAKIIWRQQIEEKPIQEILYSTSELADTILQTTINFCYQTVAERYGMPLGYDQQPMPLYILALGKLGGMELNFSSDVDLIFAYFQDGLLVKGNKEITHQEFFTKIVQSAIQVLQPQLPSQRILRVDLRLRPYGNSGAVVSSFAALEKYYQEQGRDWERYAIVKARVINDDQNATPLKTLLSSFVYRRYLDFSVLTALRNLKQTIRAQSKVASLEHDIKRGEGGIREIEFIVQALQITKGGRVKSLQTTSLLQGLYYCGQEKLLTHKHIKQLQEAYFFYRRLENCLQMFADNQVHHLPNSAGEQTRIAFALAYNNWDLLLKDLYAHQKNVSVIFKKIITPDKEQEKNHIDFMAPDLSEQQLINELKKLDIHTEHELISSVLTNLRQYMFGREATAVAKKRMTKLLPQLFSQLAKQKHPGEIFKTLQPMLIAISLRSAYLVLLLENPNTLIWLVNLANKSAWVIARITEFPMLLDELLDPQSLTREISFENLELELQAGHQQIAIDDIEAQMQYLREFKLKNELIIAIKQLDGHLNSTEVSELLTNLASLIVQQVFQWAWHHVTKRYGVLSAAPTSAHSKCLVIAYGNLGGVAMNYQSDLDLVLIFDVDQNDETNSKRNITALEFYAKLFQRMLTMLTSRTTSGVLYDIDTRLRPLGNEGLLVVSIQGFAKYQCEKAWTYEHQSLIRARAITGDQALVSQFDALRAQILQEQADNPNVKANITDMHNRLIIKKFSEQEIIKAVKNCPGGIVDIDFMVQYTVLKSAKNYPVLLESTNTAVLLRKIAEVKACSWWQHAEQLATIYQFYQQCIQILALTNMLSLKKQDELQQAQAIVKQYWQQLFEDE